ncbi:Prealbumin-like fold domain protein [anaerobic digester metagenome]
MKQLKTRILSVFLALMTVLTLLPTAALAATTSGTGISPTTDSNRWTTRLTSTGASYSYRPPMADGKYLYCLDLGYSYRYGTASFLNSYSYSSATGKDADTLLKKAVASTGLGEMNATVLENAKWMMSYIADYTGDIPGSLFMALQTYLWDNQSDKSAKGDTSGDIDAGGFANADTYEQYVGYYNWMLGQKANEDQTLQAQVEAYAQQGITATIEEVDSSKWAVLAQSSVAGRQSFFAYHATRTVVPENPGAATPDEPDADSGITIKKVDADTGKGLAGAQFKVEGINTSYQSTFTTGANGSVIITGLEAGSYKATEIVAPAGYVADATPQTFYYYQTTPVTLTFKDHSKTSITLTKTATGGAALAGCTFNIYRDGQNIGSDTTNASGKITVTGVVEGLYSFVETAAPDAYAVDPTPHEVYVDVADGSKTYTVTAANEKKPDMEIVKLDAQTGKAIVGAVFSVKSVTGSYSTSVTTSTDGKAKLPALDAGVYVVREKSVPEPYVVSNTEQTVALQPGKASTVTFTDYQKPGLEILKRNIATGEAIANVTFRIEQIDGSYSTSATTDAKGRIFLESIPVGSYKVTEVNVPANVILCDVPQTVALAAGQTSTLTFFNAVKPSLTINKVDSITSNPIAGVKFHVLRGSSNTFTGEINDLGNFTTDENGQIILTDIDAGWYRVTEMQAASGYAIADPTTQEFYLAGNSSKTVTFENMPLSAIVVYKYDSVTNAAVAGATFQIRYLGGTSGTGGTVIGTYQTSANGSFTVTGLDAGTYIVEEIASDADHVVDTSPQTVVLTGKNQDVVTLRFSNSPLGSLLIKKVCSLNSAKVLSGAEFKVTYADGTLIGNDNGSYTTDENGSILIEGLEPGKSVVVTETKAPDGFILDTTPQTAVIKAGKTVSLTFTNAPKGQLIIEKRDSVTNALLSGAEFTVTTAAGCEVGSNGNIGCGGSGTISSDSTFTTGADGKITITGLNPGAYVITETQAPDGYLIDDPTRTITITAGDTQTIVFKDTPIGGLQIIKTDDSTGARIKGVQMEVRHMNGEIVGTYTTDSNGVITLPQADSGWYTVTELKAASGYKLDTTPHNIEVKDGRTATLTITNEKLSGIIIHKVDADTREGLYGATFVLYDANGNPVGEYTSDQDGYIYVEGLESGKYQIREIEAPEGYLLDNSKKTVYVRYGDSSEIEWENTAEKGQIQLTKTSADYNSVNGWAAGTALPGAVYEVYNRANRLVDTIKTDARGVAISKPLPLGRYTVVEKTAPDNYGLDATPIDAEIEFAGQIIRLAVTDKSLFTNVSITKRGYTQAMPGQTIRYDFTNIANNSTTALTSFYWRDTLPTYATLDKIVTGTWNVRGNYKVVYKTTHSYGSYRTLADNLSTSTNYVLDASPSALGLASGEKVTEFMVVFGVVPANFRQVEAPRVTCTVSKWLKGGSTVVNNADVGGVYNGQWIMAVSRWVTTIYKPSTKLPRTGY